MADPQTPPHDLDPFGGSSPLSSPPPSPQKAVPGPIGGSSPLTSPGHPSPSAPRTPIRSATVTEAQSHDSDSEDDPAKHELPGQPAEDEDDERAQSPPLTLDEAFRSASASQTQCTPASKNIRNPKTSKLDNRKLMESELGIDKGKKVKIVSEEWARSLFGDVALASEIANFLRFCPLYNLTRKRWVKIRYIREGDPKIKEDELYDPLRMLIEATLNYFEEKRSQPGMTREVVDSHKTKLKHDNATSVSLPDISIKATGPSFERPTGKDLAYSNIASVLDVKTEQDKGSAQEQAKQLGLYNWQLFISQPNREYARSLILTDSTVRLFHFDRSGTYATPYFDIHDPSPDGGAHMLVRFVLGLSSYSEKTLGLDTSIQWSISDAGKKATGTVTVKEYDGHTQERKDVVYDMDMVEPPFVRPSLCGRGTVIWHALHPITKEKVIIKDSWRTATRVPESEYLRKANAKGIKGVVEMLACQENCAQTADYRPEGYDDPTFHNRIKSRTVMKKHGVSIWYFRTRLQLLKAYLDVIVAHQELFKNNILHRDVSMQNIALGSPSIEGEGAHGVLLDLDMAIWANRTMEEVNKDDRTGFILYQSYYTICSGSSDLPSAPHDYLDDLECFFFVLLHLFFAFEAPGKWKQKLPPVMDTWLNQTNLVVVAGLKRNFAREKMPVHLMPAWWGEPCKRLIADFGKAAKNKAQEKLAKEVEALYTKVIVAFKKAIATLAEEGPCPQELLPYPELSADDALNCDHFPLSGLRTEPPPEYHLSTNALHNVAAQGMKRSSEDDEDEGVARKRVKNYRSPLSETVDLVNQTTQDSDSDTGSDSDIDYDED